MEKDVINEAKLLGFNIGDQIQSKKPGHWFDYGIAEKFTYRDDKIWVKFNGGMCVVFWEKISFTKFGY